jgi:hypothetical protein
LLREFHLPVDDSFQNVSRSEFFCGVVRAAVSFGLKSTRNDICQESALRWLFWVVAKFFEHVL